MKEFKRQSIKKKMDEKIKANKKEEMYQVLFIRLYEILNLQNIILKELEDRFTIILKDIEHLVQKSKLLH